MTTELVTLGWREWLALPSLQLPFIHAKVDTGARTSCLHAFNIEEFEKQGKLYVRFGLHPLHNDDSIEIWRESPVLDVRQVSDSGGHREDRYVVQVELQAGESQWPIEMTLTRRDNMMFRMLLGRTAMQGRFVVNPALSWCLGRPNEAQLAANQSQLARESV